MTSTPPVDAPALADQDACLPELHVSDYLSEVFQFRYGASESLLDEDLIRRAGVLRIAVARLSTDHAPNASTLESASSTGTSHFRTSSTVSDCSASTALTAQSFGSESISQDGRQRRAKRLSFSQYDKYLARIKPDLDQPKIFKTPAAPDASSKSIFSVSTRKSFFSVRSGFKSKMRWRRRSELPAAPLLSCICCRDDFKKSSALHSLPCSHAYCNDCLRVVAEQATVEESKMPPRCCTQPVPGGILKEILEPHSQQAFLKSVVQFGTPWESRIFCPNGACGEFIPPLPKVDPKHPFSVTCRKCGTRACVMCKRNAHPVGKDCPEDLELERVLKIGEKSGWRRCYKCRSLVELTQGCTHMTCRCKAQFCYICGGVWDATVGCPNVCSGEEELERRRAEEEERLAAMEVEKAQQAAREVAEATKRQEALRRSENDPGLRCLQEAQNRELQRFEEYASKARGNMVARHDAQRIATSEKHTEQHEKMRERHAKTSSHLEDRQIAAEMELRASLEQSERSVKIRLKHMEAYCDGLGRNPSTRLPPRVITERDLRELGQQYNLRDDIERLHQSKINVLRDRQAKHMEELMDRQETELEKLAVKRQQNLEDLADRFAQEQDMINEVLQSRKARLSRRWDLAMEIKSKERGTEEGKVYAPLPPPVWSEDNNATSEVHDVFVDTES